MSALLMSIVCFVVCHGGPADHFSAFAKRLAERGWTVEIRATGPALDKLSQETLPSEIQLSPFILEGNEEEVAQALANEYRQKGAVVITDVGHPFNIGFHRALAEEGVFHLAYYDNPEFYVPGGYSSVASQVMQEADKVLFANANLANSAIYETPEKEVSFRLGQKIGVGYFSADQARTLAKRREIEFKEKRAAFFSSHSIEDQGQRVLVYIGGNNEEYFSLAFPAFLTHIEKAAKQADLSNLLIIVQQHPGAKRENIDKSLLREWVDRQEQNKQESKGSPRVLLSDLSSSEALVLADMILYYQTSMAPQFILANIPIIQIGHKRYEDVVVREKLCPVATSAEEFLEALSQVKEIKSSSDVIEKGVGMRSDWVDLLEAGIKKESEKKKSKL